MFATVHERVHLFESSLYFGGRLYILLQLQPNLRLLFRGTPGRDDLQRRDVRFERGEPLLYVQFWNVQFVGCKLLHEL